MSDWQSLLQTLLSADRSPSHGRDSWTGTSELDHGIDDLDQAFVRNNVILAEIRQKIQKF